MIKKITTILWPAFFIGGILIALFFVNLDRLRGKSSEGFGVVQQVGVILGVWLFLLGGHFLFRSFSRNVYSFLFITAVFLLSLNIYGEFVSLRSPKVEDGAYFANKFRKPSISYEQAIQQTDMGQNETNEEYAIRLTNLVYSATIHKWEDVTNYTEYNHQVPPDENYFLWALSYTNPAVYRFYEFCNPDKALERGVMVCSQAAKVMVSLWGKGTGLKARIFALDGHVVAEAQMDNSERWWVLDADFGVVLKYDMATLEQHPEIVVENYVNAGYDTAVAEKIASIYGKDGNYIQKNTLVCQKEKNLYKWKWYLPVLLLIPAPLYFGGSWLMRRRKSHAV